MLAIMKSIYDMMGRYTYPCVRDEAPYEHVDKFFQVLNAHKYKKTLKYTVLQGLFSISAQRKVTEHHKNTLTNVAFLFPTENG